MVSGRRWRKGFTLIEVLVVIAIIGLLVALLLPAVQSAREAARRTQCRNHLKQIGLAIAAYESSHRVFPIGSNFWRNAECGLPGSYNGWGWSAFILPELEQANLFDSLNFDKLQAANDPVNLSVASASVELFVCPSDPGGDEVIEGATKCPAENCRGTNMLGVEGSASGRCEYSEGMLYLISSVKDGDIKDGGSGTLLVGEVKSDMQYGWIGGNIGSTDSGINGSGFSSYHTGGAHFLFVDGHVSLLKDEIDTEVLKGLSTIAGFDSVGGEF